MNALAIDPIARTDVVPYQRIEYGTSFNFGVIAFCSVGVDYVSFAISGDTATYTGSSPRTVSSMANNTRLAHTSSGEVAGWTGWSGVWEYFISIPSSDFSSDGNFTVTPTVYSEDGNTTVLDAVPMIVEATGAGSHHYCYADSVDGNDGNCTADGTSAKCQTLGAAVAAAQTANSGSSDGNIIYLEDGNYTLSGSAPSTVNEWLTIKNSPTGSRDSIIINGAGNIDNTDFIKFEGVTLSASSHGGYIVDASDRSVWIKGCKLTSTTGRWYDCNGVSEPDIHPLESNGPTYYITDTYAYDVDRAFSGVDILRNCTAYKIAEDFTRNSPLVVNIRMDDQNNGYEEGNPLTNCTWHADSYQQFGNGQQNFIIYNYYGTDAHYQGFYMRNDGLATAGLAIVNCFLEMREPHTYGGAGSGYVLGSGTEASVQDIDNFIFWHNSFPYTNFQFNGAEVSDWTNVSVIGNVFYEFIETTQPAGVEPTWIGPSNSFNNVCTYNHYKGSFTDVDDCGGAPPQPAGCPYYTSKSPDTDANGTATTGLTGQERYHPEVFDLTDTSTYLNFGYPDPNADQASYIIDALPSNITGIPADLFGNQRDSTPDKGAIEYAEGAEDTNATITTGVGGNFSCSP